MLLRFLVRRDVNEECVQARGLGCVGDLGEVLLRLDVLFQLPEFGLHVEELLGGDYTGEVLTPELLDFLHLRDNVQIGSLSLFRGRAYGLYLLTYGRTYCTGLPLIIVIIYWRRGPTRNRGSILRRGRRAPTAGLTDRFH